MRVPPFAAKSGAKGPWLGSSCHRLKHEPSTAQQLIRDLRRLSAEKGVALGQPESEATLTYFPNWSRAGQMEYAGLVESHVPIGCRVHVRPLDAGDWHHQNPGHRPGDPFPINRPACRTELKTAYRVGVRSVTDGVEGRLALGDIGTVTAIEEGGCEDLHRRGRVIKRETIVGQILWKNW